MDTNNETPNQFRQSQSPVHSTEEPMGAKLPEPERELAPKTGWQNAVLIGLGVLLIVGGIALGLRNHDSSKIVDLPDYSVETPGPSGEVSETPAESPTPTEESASPTPASPDNQPSSAPVVAKSSSQTRKVAAQPVKKITATSTVQPVSSSLPEYSPVYQAVVGLPEYQPQVSSPSPTAQTITIRLVTPGHTYTIEAYQTVTVAALMQAARSQGFSYETKQFSFGSLVTSINGQSEGNGKYWTFTKNGDFSQLGIDAQTVSNGDVIAWSLAAI
jgi:hypothetical protein